MSAILDRALDAMFVFLFPPVPEDVTYCPYCGGTGYIRWDLCDHCHGIGFVEINQGGNK